MSNPNINTDGFVWVKAWAEKRITELHNALEAPGTPEDSTNLLRGQLQDVRRLLEDSRQAVGARDE